MITNDDGPAIRHKRTIAPLREEFEAFIRTGVWGTCAECPFLDGKKVPELCVNTKRYDHQFSARALFERYESDFYDIRAGQ